MRALFCILIGMSAIVAHAAEYDRITLQMENLHAAYPGRTELFELGENDQSETIRGIRIFSAAQGEKTAIDQLLVGTHHGNERLSADLVMQVAVDLLAAEQDDARLTDVTLHMIPVLNISGFNRNGREERDGGGTSRDPNRDYPDPCIDKENFHLRSTAMLAEYLMSYQVVTAVTVHGYIGTFTYPWGIYTDQTHTADHTTYDAIARGAVALNGYRTGTHSDLIYPAAGAFEDWAYHDHGVWTMLLELANRPNLPRDSAAVREFFAAAPRERSTNHRHTGNCTQTIDMLGLSRP